MKNQEEVFKDIKDFEGLYQVSNLGNVKALDRLINHWRGGKRLIKEKILKPSFDSHSYLKICLHKNRRQSTKMIHT